MEIPSSIKIQGKIVKVNVSARGYVVVGESPAFMDDNTKKHLNSLSGTEHISQWEDEMHRLFELALTDERNRLKAFER